MNRRQIRGGAGGSGVVAIGRRQRAQLLRSPVRQPHQCTRAHVGRGTAVGIEGDANVRGGVIVGALEGQVGTSDAADRVPRTITVPVRKTYGSTFWFRLYAVYDVAQGPQYLPIERRAFVREFSIPTVPLVHEALVFDASCTMQAILAMADGPSAIGPTRRRVGLVFKSTISDDSFKAIASKYLLNEKLC